MQPPCPVVRALDTSEVVRRIVARRRADHRIPLHHTCAAATLVELDHVPIWFISYRYTPIPERAGEVAAVRLDGQLEALFGRDMGHRSVAHRHPRFFGLPLDIAQPFLPPTSHDSRQECPRPIGQHIVDEAVLESKSIQGRGKSVLRPRCDGCQDLLPPRVSLLRLSLGCPDRDKIAAVALYQVDVLRQPGR